MPDYTPNFAGIVDALKTIITTGIAGGGSGGGGGGDASALNQQTEITRLTEIRDRLPFVLVNDRMKVDLLSSQSINIGSVKDYINSSLISTTALAASAIFTSSAQTSSGNKIRGWVVVTPQTGNLYVEHSRDAINWRGILAGTVCNNGVTGFEQQLYSNYYRLVYINGATAQTTFELVATQFGIGA